MPFCPNCGSQIKTVHHYCRSCGQALLDIAESEADSPMAVDREGFLLMRSLSYVNDLLKREQELDHKSVSYTQLSRGVSASLTDFARLAMVSDLGLLHLWAAGSNTNALSMSVDEMNSNQFRGRLAAMGIRRTFRMYDDALQTEFEDQFNDRLQKLIEFANEEIDDEGSLDNFE